MPFAAITPGDIRRQAGRFAAYSPVAHFCAGLERSRQMLRLADRETDQ